MISYSVAKHSAQEQFLERYGKVIATPTHLDYAFMQIFIKAPSRSYALATSMRSE